LDGQFWRFLIGKHTFITYSTKAGFDCLLDAVDFRDDSGGRGDTRRPFPSFLFVQYLSVYHKFLETTAAANLFIFSLCSCFDCNGDPAIQGKSVTAGESELGVFLLCIGPGDIDWVTDGEVRGIGG